jgi:DNA-binding MarR family transcriptional regulator
VTRSHDSPDQREVHIHITPRGCRLQAEVTYIRSRRTLAALSRLSQEDREAVSEALPVLEAVASSAMGCAVPNGPQAGSVVRGV